MSSFQLHVVQALQLGMISYKEGKCRVGTALLRQEESVWLEQQVCYKGFTTAGNTHWAFEKLYSQCRVRKSRQQLLSSSVVFTHFKRVRQLHRKPLSPVAGQWGTQTRRTEGQQKPPWFITGKTSRISHASVDAGELHRDCTRVHDSTGHYLHTFAHLKQKLIWLLS